MGAGSSFASTVLVLAVNVRVHAQAGRGDELDVDRRSCRQHLSGLVGAAPWLNIQARVALARDALLRGDRVEAAVLVDEAQAVVAALPGAAGGSTQLAAIKQQLTPVRDRTKNFGPSSLRTAELRVLRLLPTHLALGEMSGRPTGDRCVGSSCVRPWVAGPHGASPTYRPRRNDPVYPGRRRASDGR